MSEDKMSEDKMSEDKMMTREDWEKEFEKTQSRSDISEREAKTIRIMSDPKPQWREEDPKPYKTIEKHYIMCVDENLANESMPEAKAIGEEFTHKFGNILISDRAEMPAGWIKKPPTGAPIEIIQEKHPELYAFLRDVKKVSNF